MVGGEALDAEELVVADLGGSGTGVLVRGGLMGSHVGSRARGVRRRVGQMFQVPPYGIHALPAGGKCAVRVREVSEVKKLGKLGKFIWMLRRV